MLKSTQTRYVQDFYYYSTDEMIGVSLEYYGEYCQLELEFLLSMIGKNSTVYDIGANIGYHTTAFASRAKKVYAFEPHPKTFALLEKNTEDFDNIFIGQYAVSSHRHTCYVNDYNTDSIGNFGTVNVVSDTNAIPIRAIDLDTAGLDLPDLIKIDVEGHEYAVLQGCKGIIQSHTPVIYYEAHESEHLKEIYNLLSPDRYRFYWAQCTNYNPANFKQNANNIFGETGLMSILAWPRTLQTLPMLEVTGADDDVKKFYQDGKI